MPPTKAFMTGLFGVKPDFVSIVPAIADDQVDALTPQIKYDNVSVQSATRNLADWMLRTPGPRTVWTYSESTDAVTSYFVNNPNNLQDRFYLLGSPSVPGNYNTSSSWMPLPDGDFSNVTFVVRQYDSVADYPRGTSYSARSNAKLSVHTDGYDGLNLANPDATYVDPRTGSTTLYFLTYPLPSISLTTWWGGKKTAQQIATEDIQKRPPIESQYTDRPIKLPDPVRPLV